MSIAIKRFNWKVKPTAWESAQAWRQHRSNMAQKFRAEADAAGVAFATAQTNLSVGLATIATQVMIERLQKEVSAAVRSQIDLLI